MCKFIYASICRHTYLWYTHIHTYIYIYYKCIYLYLSHNNKLLNHEWFKTSIVKLTINHHTIYIIHTHTHLYVCNAACRCTSKHPFFGHCPILLSYRSSFILRPIRLRDPSPPWRRCPTWATCLWLGYHLDHLGWVSFWRELTLNSMFFLQNDDNRRIWLLKVRMFHWFM